MIRIIIGVLLTVAIICIVKLALTKKKKRSQLGESEKFLLTIKSKLKKAFKDLNDGIRTPDVIQEEIIQLLEDYKKEAIKSFKKSGTLLIEQKSRLVNSLNDVNKNIENIDKKVKEYKKKYETETDPSLKKSYLDAGTNLLRSKHNFEKSKEKIADAVKKAEEAKENMLRKSEQMDIKISVKRAQVLSIISDYINGVGNVNVDINFSDIDFLVDEYKLVSEKEDYKKEVDKRLDKQPEEELEIIGDKELEEEFKKL